MGKILLFIVLLISTIGLKGQILVTPTNVGLALAQKLVGTGVSISNVTFRGGNNSCGFFINRNSPIQLDSGIVLTSGFAETNGILTGIDGNAAGDDASENNGAVGDVQLGNLVGQPTQNAAILEFDFVPQGDTISFSYVFSSEEYPLYNCSDFNDVFAFFIDGPGIVGVQNIALIPGTSIPVAINSINSGVPGPGESITLCNNMGAGSPFTSLYLNNSIGTALTHNGLTVRLEAKARVQPCQTYHLKIAIADVSDGMFDSGVFLQANSLNSIAVACEAVGTFDPSTSTIFLAEGCQSGGIKFTVPNLDPLPTVINLAFAGTATNGVDATSIPTSIIIPANTASITLPITAFTDAFTEGVEFLTVYLTSPCNSALYLDSVRLDIRDYDMLSINPADSAYVCNIGSPIQLTASNGYTTYTWDANATLSATNIANPIATPTALPVTYYCTAVLGTCRARDSVKINEKAIAAFTTVDVNCKNGTTGVINIEPGTSWARPLSFSINGSAPQTDSSFSNLPTGNYTVSVTDNIGCSKSTTVSLIQAFPDLVFTEIITPPNCGTGAGTITVNATGGRSPYEYSLNGINYFVSNVLATATVGTFNIFVKDANGCITFKVVTMVPNNTLQITSTSNTPASCNGNADGSITVNISGGIAPYQYSSNGGTSFQTSNVLQVTSGTKVVTVKDNVGCTVSVNVTIAVLNNLTVNAGLPVTICEGTSIGLVGTASGTANQWTPNIAITNASTLTPTVAPTTITKYYLTTSTSLCTKVDSVIVTVRPAPLANAGMDTTICFGKTINLTGTGGTIFTWLPNYNITNANTATPTINPLVNTTYWLQVEDAFGCKSLQADSVNVTLIPPIVMNAGRDTLIAVNQPLQLNATGSPLYLWTPSTWLSNPNINNPVATIGVTGLQEYYLKGFTAEGCLGFDTIKVNVYKGPEIYVPTAFTPNGDGVNDVLKITTVGYPTLKYFRIFNRWGQLVFETKDATKGWNGKFNNLLQPLGTYVWMVEGIDYKGNIKQKKGTVLIVL